MTIIDNYPNAERTLTYIEALLITEREYQRLKKISEKIKEDIEKDTECEINSYWIIKYYLEQAIRRSECESIANDTHKEIIIGNIILPDDIQIAELLNKNEYTKERLKEIIRFRSLLKKIILNFAPIDEELERKFNEYKDDISEIKEIFKSELNIDDQTIILNRITEILQTHPNYFESKHSERTRKR